MTVNRPNGTYPCARCGQPIHIRWVHGPLSNSGTQKAMTFLPEEDAEIITESKDVGASTLWADPVAAYCPACVSTVSELSHPASSY